MICAVIALYSLVLTESRAGWLLLSVSLIYLIAKGNTAVLRSAIFCIILCLIAINFWLDWEKVSFMITHRVEFTYNNNVTGGIDASTMGRFYIWEKVVNDYNPLYLITGYGIRNAYNIFGSTTHNTYLSLFIYSGLIGYVVMSKMIMAAKHLSGNSEKNARTFLNAALFGICAYGLSADILYDIRVFTLALCIISFFILSNSRMQKI